MFLRGLIAILFVAFATFSIQHLQNDSDKVNPLRHSTAGLALAKKSDRTTNYLPLRAAQDDALNVALRRVLEKNPKWKSMIRNRKLAVGLVDLRNERAPRYASVNGQHMMYAASLPKIAVLLAAMDAIEQGELRETRAVKDDMFLMINKSNNAATTRMIDRVGFNRIQRVLTSDQYRLYDRNQGGGLWVGKRYAAGGQRMPDPMKGLSHAATAEQVCRFYYMLHNDALVSPERSAQMKQILTKPGLHHKFVNTLDRVAPRADLFRKSGSWKTYHSDSVMVLGEDRKYILVGLADDPAGEQIMRELVLAAEQAMREAV